MGLKSHERIIAGIHDIENIPDPPVRIVAQYVFEQLHPGEDVTLGYETHEFEHELHYKKEGTKPDLSVNLPNGNGYFLEVTRSNKGHYYQQLQSLPIWLGKTNVVCSESGGIDLLPVLVESDPKSRQKRVMQNVVPEKEYYVLYGEDLERIRRITNNEKGT